MNIEFLSNKKYKLKNDNVINDGAFANIYDIINSNEKTKDYIVKLQKKEYKYEAINEIESLLKLQKNKTKYLNKLKEFNITVDKPKVIELLDYYIDNDYFYLILPKYECTLEYFNILYNKEFNEILPINLIKKITNSLFLSIYQLHYSNLIHCDIKPNNILIDLKYKNLKQFIKDIKNKKIKKNDLINYIDIVLIDFNKTQKNKSIYKSTNIQILYYMAPEIVLNNKEFNNSIDIWSVGIIIYELIAGRYLFDIYKDNLQNGNNFKNYNLNQKSKITTDYSYTDSADSYEKSYKIEYLSLLYNYKFILGDNTLLYGNDLDIFYSNNLLLGDINNNNSENNLIPYITQNIKITNTDFLNHIFEILKKIFVYDYNNRLTAEEFLTKYKF
jgi:serine/threonine protein kinase